MYVGEDSLDFTEQSDIDLPQLKAHQKSLGPKEFTR